MFKEFNINKAEQTFQVKLERDMIQDKLGLVVVILNNGKCVKRHFLDFSAISYTELEFTMRRFINHFNQHVAEEWVEVYLKECNIN